VDANENKEAPLKEEKKEESLYNDDFSRNSPSLLKFILIFFALSINIIVSIFRGSNKVKSIIGLN